MKKILLFLLLLLFVSCNKTSENITNEIKTPVEKIKKEVDPFIGFNVSISDSENTEYIFDITEDTFISSETNALEMFYLQNLDTNETKSIILSYWSPKDTILINKGKYKLYFIYKNSKDGFIKFNPHKFNKVNLELNTSYTVKVDECIEFSINILEDGFYKLSDGTNKSYNRFELEKNNNTTLDLYNKKSISFMQGENIYLKKGIYTVTNKNIFSFINYYGFFSKSEISLEFNKQTPSLVGTVLFGKSNTLKINQSTIGALNLILDTQKTLIVKFESKFQYDSFGGIFLIDNESKNIFRMDDFKCIRSEYEYSISLPKGNYTVYETFSNITPAFKIE